jgi:hypothetical protein
VRLAIEQNTVEVFRRREAFRRNGVPFKRGIILHGAPGTGKTLVGKVLAGLKLATFIYVTAADMSGLESVRSIFDLARRLSPTILFFEDIDLFADDRSSYCSKAMLGEILAQLDGFESNDGLVFIATTNDLAAIDPAIRERPSRFDALIHLDLPSREARRNILLQNLPHNRRLRYTARRGVVHHRRSFGCSGAGSRLSRPPGLNSSHYRRRRPRAVRAMRPRRRRRARRGEERRGVRFSRRAIRQQWPQEKRCPNLLTCSRLLRVNSRKMPSSVG